MIYDNYDGVPYDYGYGNFGAQPYYGVPPYYGTLPYAGVSPVYMDSQYGGTGLYGANGTSPFGYSQPYTAPYAGLNNNIGSNPYEEFPYNSKNGYGPNTFSGGLSPYSGLSSYGAPNNGPGPYGYPALQAGYGGGYGGWGGGYGWGLILLGLAFAAAVAFYFYRRGFFSW